MTPAAGVALTLLVAASAVAAQTLTLDPGQSFIISAFMCKYNYRFSIVIYLNLFYVNENEKIKCIAILHLNLTLLIIFK